MLHFKIEGEEYALRKYIIKSFAYYIQKKYPNTCRELTEITPDMLDDSSDVINFTDAFSAAINVEHFPYLDTSNGENFSSMYGTHETTYRAKSYPLINTSKGKNFNRMYGGYGKHTINDIKFPAIDTSNGENFSWMYRSNSYTTEFPDINTSKGKNFSWMYCDCYKAIKVSDIDLSSISTEDITTNKKLDNMLLGCNSLPSVTFNNVPAGITVEQMRTTTGAPETCEIILNHRNQ